MNEKNTQTTKKTKLKNNSEKAKLKNYFPKNS